MSLSKVEVFYQLLNSFKDATKSQEVPIKTTLISLFLWGVKVFLTEIVFECPNKHYAAYGSLFIFGPAVLLFCISMLVSDSFWHVVTGCGRLSFRQRRIVWWKSRNSVYLALIPPLLWFVLAFMESKYFVCIKLGPLKSALAKVNGAKAEEAVEEEFGQAKSESEIIAWGLLLSLVILSTLLVTIHRFFAKLDPAIHGLEEYDNLESNEVVRLFNERITRLAEEGAQKVMQDLEGRLKDEAPDKAIQLSSKYLKELYPKAAGVFNGIAKTYAESEITDGKMFALSGGKYSPESIPLRESGEPSAE